jgi:hypothetical protein
VADTELVETFATADKVSALRLIYISSNTWLNVLDILYYIN